jgi:hypothetical protein
LEKRKQHNEREEHPNNEVKVAAPAIAQAVEEYEEWMPTSKITEWGTLSCDENHSAAKIGS